MKRKFFYTLFLLISWHLSEAQILEDVVGKLQLFNSQFPQEKVYIHSDKSKYYLGEDIWFKAYLINAQYKDSDPVSNVLRVELIDPQIES